MSEGINVFAGDTTHFIHRPPNPEKVKQAKLFELIRSTRLSQELKQKSHEVSEVVVEEKNQSIKKFSERAKRYGLDLKEPSIHYIDSSKRNEVLEAARKAGLTKNSIDHDLAFTFGSNIVIFTEPGMSDLDLFFLTNHEINHAYTNKISKLRQTETSLKTRVSTKGALLVKDDTIKGFLFEEGIVRKETEDYALSLETKYPDKFSKRKDDLAKTKRGLAIRHHLNSPDHTTSWSTTEGDIKWSTELDTLITIHKKIEEKLTNWNDIVAKARCTGKWNEVRERIDGEFGKGVFSLLFSIEEKQFDLATSGQIMEMLEGRISPDGVKQELKKATASLQAPH